MNLLISQRQKIIDKFLLSNVKDQLRKQVLYLNTLPNPKQRTDEWFNIRRNKITASMIAPLLKVGRYGSRRELIGEKAGILKSEFKGNFYTNWGTDFEKEAIKIYSKIFNTTVKDYSLIEHSNYPFLGASPDGINEDGTMLEIKCPPKREIVGIIPDHYECQVQLQLEVCDLEVCDFLECLFSKYDSRKEFLADNDFSVELNGFEDLPKFKKIHCDDFLFNGYTIFKGTRDKSEYELSSNSDDKFIYWKLEKMSCIQIRRDRDWFNKALPKLEEAWNEILHFREHPDEFNKKYPTKPELNIGFLSEDGSIKSRTETDELNTKEVNNLADLI